MTSRWAPRVASVAPEPEAPAGIPPWHMWGTTQQLNPVNNSQIVTQQLARVNYKRPTTWSFLFTLSLNHIPTGSSPGLTLSASFSLIVGLGRTQVQLPNFCVLGIPVPTGEGGGPNTTVWSTVAPTNGLLVAGAPSQQFLSQIAAQDIQCSVLSSAPVGAQTPITIECGAFFAPIEHVRPDWFRERGQRFTGAEDGGR